MFTLGVPGEITKNLKKLKHAMTESKYKSKGVPTLEITDELSKAVSDMGFLITTEREIACSMLYWNNWKLLKKFKFHMMT